MANNHKQDKSNVPHHKSSSWRIQRRLSQQVQQDGLSAEAQREKPMLYSSAKKQSKKKKQTSGKDIPLCLFWYAKTREDIARPKRCFFWLKAALICLASLAIIVGDALATFLSVSTRHDSLWLDRNQIPYKTETILYATNPETQQQAFKDIPEFRGKLGASGGIGQLCGIMNAEPKGVFGLNMSESEGSGNEILGGSLLFLNPNEPLLSYSHSTNAQQLKFRNATPSIQNITTQIDHEKLCCSEKSQHTPCFTKMIKAKPMPIGENPSDCGFACKFYS